jgi:hypothetical protein
VGSGEGEDSGEAGEGGDSCDGEASWDGEASFEGAAPWEGETSGVVLDCGAWVGGLSEPVELEDWAGPCERVPFALAAFALRPGKALAATSEKMAASAREPATIQRLALLSRRKATSLAFEWIGGIVLTHPFDIEIHAPPLCVDEMIHIKCALRLLDHQRSAGS